MSFTNCENMTTYATNEYALNRSLSKFQKGNYTLYRHVTGIQSFLFPRIIYDIHFVCIQ